MKLIVRKISLSMLMAIIAAVGIELIFCVHPSYGTASATEETERKELQEQRQVSEENSDKPASTVDNILNALKKNIKTEIPDNKLVITDIISEAFKQQENVSVAVKEIITDIDAKITKQREETAKQIKEITADIDAKIAKQKVFTWITLILVIISDVIYVVLQFLPAKR